MDEAQGGSSAIPADPESPDIFGGAEAIQNSAATTLASEATDEDEDEGPDDEADPGEEFPESEGEAAVIVPDEATPVLPAVIGCTESGPIGGPMTKVCITHQAPDLTAETVDDSADDTGAITTQKVQAFPSSCNNSSLTWTYRSRRTMCEVEGMDVTITQGTRVIGYVFFNVYNLVYTATDNAVWAHQVQLKPVIIEGVAAGMRVSGNAYCTGGCKVQSSAYHPTVIVLDKKTTGQSYHKSTVTAKGTKGYGSTKWRINFEPASAPVTYGDVTPSPNARCDNAVPGLTKVGCVISKFSPVLYYQAAVFPDLVAHLKAAQNSGLAGKYPGGTPLTRLTNSKTIKSNRSRACPGSLVRPAGKTCDEYPFASTNEGAKTGGGTARTFSWCSVPGSSSTGPTGYSRCMIDGPQNSAGGSALGKFYKGERVILNDKFRVALR